MASITAVSTRPKPRAKKAPKPAPAVDLTKLPEVVEEVEPVEKSGWTYFWNDERITEAIYHERCREHVQWVIEEEKKKEALRLAAEAEKKKTRKTK